MDDLRLTKWATMNTCAEAGANFFRGPSGVSKSFLGDSKMVGKISLNARHMMTLLDPVVVLMPKGPFSLVLQFGVKVPLWRRVGADLGVPPVVDRNSLWGGEAPALPNPSLVRARP